MDLRESHSLIHSLDKEDQAVKETETHVLVEILFKYIGAVSKTKES